MRTPARTAPLAGECALPSLQRDLLSQAVGDQLSRILGIDLRFVALDPMTAGPEDEQLHLLAFGVVLEGDERGKAEKRHFIRAADQSGIASQTPGVTPALPKRHADYTSAAAASV